MGEIVMGAYTCEYGVVHKTCRCPTPHTIRCDKVEEHKDINYVPKHRAEPVEEEPVVPVCIVCGKYPQFEPGSSGIGGALCMPCYYDL